MSEKTWRVDRPAIQRCEYPRCDTLIEVPRFLCRAHWGQLSAELKLRLGRATQVAIKDCDEDAIAALRMVQGECLRSIITWDMEQAP